MSKMLKATSSRRSLHRPACAGANQGEREMKFDITVHCEDEFEAQMVVNARKLWESLNGIRGTIIAETMRKSANNHLEPDPMVLDRLRELSMHFECLAEIRRIPQPEKEGK
jgi:hypothetical protein